MMPIGVPKVAYRVPGAQTADWVDIYNRLYREVSSSAHIIYIIESGSTHKALVAVQYKQRHTKQ
jgi:hypothetical protein